MHITFLAPAEAELLNAVAYYNSQSEGGLATNSPQR